LGASAVQEIPNGGPWGKANDYYWMEVVPSLVASLRRGDWVFLISDMAEFSARDPTEVGKLLVLLESGLRRLSEKLKGEGLRLAVLHGIPFAREANCIPAQAPSQWFTPFHNQQCHFFSKEETLKRRSKLDSVLVALQNKGDIRIIDLFEIFCPDRICTYEAKNGQILYRDEWSHPSVEAARLSAPIIREVLTAPNERYFSGYADANLQGP
jgi:hypothetical protein